MAGLNDFLIFDEKKITHRSYCNGKKIYTGHSPEEIFETAQTITFEKPASEEIKPPATPQSEPESEKKDWQEPETVECEEADIAPDTQEEMEAVNKPEEQDTEPYRPLPGQITIQGIPELKTDVAAAETDENIIDGTCRDLKTDICPYTISDLQESEQWYANEIERIDGLPGELRKQQKLEIGLWAIRQYLNINDRKQG